jgi:hypothetical protein
MSGQGMRMPNGQFVPQREEQPAPAMTSPVAPAQVTQRALPQDYNATIAQQESGNRPGIGYHNPQLSSAYGQYGITNAAYQDARRLNPNLPADITQATPEQQTQAMTAFTQQNAKYLQGYGIEPTPANLSAAHLLGARGLNDYLRSGTFSPQAAAANGGEERLRAIVNSRLAGQPGAASGAAQPVSPAQQAQQETQAAQAAPPAQAAPAEAAPSPLQQHIDYYQKIQGDKNALIKYSQMEGAPEFLKERARNQFVDQVQNDRKLAAAQSVIDQGDPATIQRAMSKRNTDANGGGVGDWMQYLLFKAVGLSDLANEKGEALGIGHKWEGAMDAEGNTGLIQYTASGRPISGVKADGTDMTRNELAAYAAQGLGKASDVSGTQKQAMVNGELHTISTKRTAQGTLYRDDTAGTGWSRIAPAGMTHLGQVDPAHVKGLTAMNTEMSKMRKTNQDSALVGQKPYTEEQIQAAGRRAYEAVAGKTYGGGGFSPATEEGQVTPGAQPQAGARPAPAAAPVQSRPTAAPAANAPRSQAQQILDYDAPPPSGPTTAAKIALNKEVERLAAEQGKQFNAGNYKIASSFNNSMSGKALKAINVAVDHLDTLQEAANELKNGQTPAFNKIANLYASNTGSTAPGNFDALKSIVGSEVAKAVVGGASALGDREEIRKEIDNSKTPEQLAGVIGRFQALMAGQAKGIRQEWVSSGLDERRFDDKLMPRTKVVLNKQKQPTRSNY